MPQLLSQVDTEKLKITAAAALLHGRSRMSAGPFFGFAVSIKGGK
jgi:hypothetical protein